MRLSKEQVRHVATLARLELNSEEEERFSVQLSAVLENINQLNDLDTEGVEPTSHALDVNNVFREDVISKRFDNGCWKLNVPSEHQNHFRVPKIIKD